MTDTRCYMIIFGAFTDFDQFVSEYQSKVEQVMDRFGGQYVLIGEALEVLEGQFPSGGGAVISVWPNRQAALSFWKAPECRKLNKVKIAEGKLQVALIQAPTLAGVA